MLTVATTESQVGSWDKTVARSGGARRTGRARLGLGRGGSRPLRFPALPRRRALPAERDRAPGSARARAPREAARARPPHPRANRGHAAPRDGSVETRAAGAGRRGGPRGELGRGRLPGLPASRSRSHRATSSSRSRSRTCSTSSAGRAARRSSTAARSSTTRGRRATAASSSAGAAGGWGSAAGARSASSSTRASSRRRARASSASSRRLRGRG